MERIPSKILAYLALFLPVYALGSSDTVFQSNFEASELPVDTGVPGISLSFTGTFKDTDGTPGTSAGDRVDYIYKVTNTGNVTLDSVILSASNGVNIDGNTLDSIAPGGQKTRSGNYTVTQDDINSGTVSNSASATGQCADSACPVNDNASYTHSFGPQVQVCKIFYQDADGDNYGLPGSATEYCSYNPQGPSMPAGMTDVADDCNDADEYSHPGATENAPDLQLKDENCDGLDGHVDLAVMVSAIHGIDFPRCGYLTAPCKSIEKALDRATSMNRSQIYIQEGTYTGPLLIEDHIFLYGGYDPDDWSRAADKVTKITGGKLGSRELAIEITNVTVGMQLVTLEAPDIDSGGYNDPNSYAIYAQSGADIFLEQVTIRQGNGRNAADGADGMSASHIRALSGGTGGDGAVSSTFCDTIRSARGAYAENSCPGYSDITKSGPGGLGGKMNDRIVNNGFGDICEENAEDGADGANAAVLQSGSIVSGGIGGAGLWSCQPGGDGENGRVSDGFPGSAGAGGGFYSAIWRSQGGGNGSVGNHGGGGGGGGGAGGCDQTPEARGGGGGGGGAGGCRAKSYGVGGYGGGASFGVQVLNGALEVRHSVFERGQGGSGGNGGKSGAGQPGGLGGLGGGGASYAKAGGNGGAGAHGGHSGGGGGGAGGPSCGIAAINSSVIRNESNHYSGGAGGTGGSGGSGPVPGADGQNGALCELLTD